MAKKTKKPAEGETIQLYKVLTKDGHSPYITAYAWSLPTKNDDGSYTPGAWHEEPESALDAGRGLHVTPSPMRYRPNNECITYACEASGYREDPATDNHVVATKVRLLHPITNEEARKASSDYDAGTYVRAEKARNKYRLDRARQSAVEATQKNTARRAAGVQSPALLAFAILDELTPTESWRDVNSCRRDALEYATKYLKFDPDDAAKILNDYGGGYWGNAEQSYRTAIAAKNLSACAAWERCLGRKPWWYNDPNEERVRLALGSRIDWQGRRCTITSFKGDESFVACAYKTEKKVTSGGHEYEEETRIVEKRFTVTRATFAEAFGKKKETAVAA